MGRLNLRAFSTRKPGGIWQSRATRSKQNLFHLNSFAAKSLAGPGQGAGEEGDKDEGQDGGMWGSVYLSRYLFTLTARSEAITGKKEIQKGLSFIKINPSKSYRP